MTVLSGVTVRPAAASDVSAVAALEQELFGLDAWSVGSVREELTGERRHAAVAVVDDAVVGYAVTLRSGDVLDLQRIAVSPAHRRQGLAQALLEGVREAGRIDGAARMLLEVSADNAAALAFYDREGFVEIDRRPRYYRDGSDALVLLALLPTGGTDG